MILITGANRGVGAALLAGYRARGDTALGTTRADPAPDGLITLDVTDPAAQRRAAGMLGAAPLSLLVCNAGVLLDDGERLADGYPAQIWAQTLAVNVTGVFLTVQAFLPALRAGGGKVAIISSQLGSTTRAGPGRLAYRASKAAATNLGRNLAAELRPEGIAVGVYHPGWVRTDMGTSRADISPQESASGLMARFDALSPATTGVVEMWDGTALPY